MRLWTACLITLIAPFAAAQTATLELSDCRIDAGRASQGVNARCAEMERPLDPDSPDGETITLQIAVIPALDLDPLPDPVVPIAGGPGMSTIDMYILQRGAFEALRRQRDIVLIDQRGTGESSPMSCDVDEEVIEGVLSREQTRDATRQCLDTLSVDPRFFTTSVAVRDIDAVRDALGYPEINVYGVSYGSRVAQHYARRFPENIRTLIIDGVVPPSLPLGPDIAIESQRAMERLIERCAEDATCSDAFPNLDIEFAGLVADLDAAPRNLTVADPVTGRLEDMRFGRAEMAGAVRLLLYTPPTVALLPLLIHNAAGGDLAPLASAMKMTTGEISGSLAIGMHNSVICTEDAPFYDAFAIADRNLESTYMGPMMIEALQDICSVWPAGVMDTDLRTPLSVDVPVLLLSGTADPITPPAYAERAMASMPNARHIVGRDQGHGQIAVGCMPDLLADFVDSADPQAIDTSCFEERSHVMPFFIDFTGPSP